MLEYILKRLLWFIPTLLLVTLLGFLLLVSAPGDPLDQLVPALSSKNPEEYRAQRAYWSKQLGLDLPVFYVSVKQWSEPDNLYKIKDPERLKVYKHLLSQTGNQVSVKTFLNRLDYTATLFEKESKNLKTDSSYSYDSAFREKENRMLSSLRILHYATTEELITQHISSITSDTAGFSTEFASAVSSLKGAYSTLLHTKTRYKNFIPKIVWYGSHNRYHLWLFGDGNNKGVICGDFGISYRHKQPVLAVISDKVIWSLFFSLLSIILAYLVSIPIGIRLAQKPHTPANRLIQTGLFLLYSTPVFFGGVLLLMLFANPDILSIFPPSGIKPIGGYADDAGLFEKLSDSLPYIVLPLICYIYSSLAYISRLTQTSLMEQLPLDYIKTARAKGLSDHAVIRKHALKNSLLPLITVFSAVFPSIIGGSVIIESIFTIPGMGLETVKAIISKDYPVVIAIITLSCLLTMLSYLIADILYAWADPRIRHKS